MDSSVWISLIGVCGTLGGAFFGAWLNPYMQEKKETRRLKRILKEASPLDKFIIFNAYRNMFLPLNGMLIIQNPQLDFESIQIINYFDDLIMQLVSNVKKLNEERILFAYEEYYAAGYRLVLNNGFYSLIHQNKKIKEELIKGNQPFIKDEVYPLCKKIIESEAIFNFLQQSQQSSASATLPLSYLSIFMHNIGIFNMPVDVKHLNPTSPKDFLNFPKGEFHPEYKG